jgi:amino acid transporter
MVEPSSSSVAELPRQPELKRAIGPKLLLFFVVGDILGTGIYALTGDVAARIGGALWVPFLAAFILAFLTAFQLPRAGRQVPGRGRCRAVHAQGVRRPVPHLHGHLHGDELGGETSAAKAFGDTYLRQFATLPLWLVAAAFVTGLALINFRGVGESMKANVLLTCIELSGLLIIIGAGMWAIGQGQGDASRLVEVDTSNSGVLLSITAATSLAFFAMVGFEDSVNMAEETRGR